MNDIYLSIGSAVALLWGIGHLIPTKSIVDGFGGISEDNKRIITMEWLMEGLALCFIGLLVLVVASVGDTSGTISRAILWMCAGMLIVMAVVSFLTGARTSIVPMKICPWVKSLAAILIALGARA